MSIYTVVASIETTTSPLTNAYEVSSTKGNVLYQIFCKHHYIESNFIVLGGDFTSSNIMEASTSKNEISISIIVVIFLITVLFRLIIC